MLMLGRRSGDECLARGDGLDISFRTKKLRKVFNSQKRLRREYGELAEKIAMRMAVLREATTLAEIPHTPPFRRHQLTGRRKGQFAVDLRHPHRLVFEPAHNPVPRLEDGGVDLSQVSAITIIKVEDYH